jgi:DnaK suppressor protein
MMTTEQVNEFKHLFIQILDQDFVGPDQSWISEAGDEVDQAAGEKAAQLELKLLSRNHVFRKKIRKALDKIHEHTFGECEECGADIGYQRLKARPCAELCILCKEEEERGGLNFIHKNKHSRKFAGAQLLELKVES